MKYLTTIFVLTLFISCSPRLHYLGDVHPATTEVDTYYSPDDIDIDFKVIGHLTGSNEDELFFGDLDGIKNAMIEEAMKRGANGILFLFADSYGENHSVKADLLLYRK